VHRGGASLKGIFTDRMHPMHHWLNGENVLASATRQPAAAVQAHKVFLLAYLRLKIQPVSIRSVSTKLKVNSGRTNPSSTSLKKRKHAE